MDITFRLWQTLGFQLFHPFKEVYIPLQTINLQFHILSLQRAAVTSSWLGNTSLYMNLTISSIFRCTDRAVMIYVFGLGVRMVNTRLKMDTIWRTVVGKFHHSNLGSLLALGGKIFGNSDYHRNFVYLCGKHQEILFLLRLICFLIIFQLLDHVRYANFIMHLRVIVSFFVWLLRMSGKKHHFGTA